MVLPKHILCIQFQTDQGAAVVLGGSLSEQERLEVSELFNKEGWIDSISLPKGTQPLPVQRPAQIRDEGAVSEGDADSNEEHARTPLDSPFLPPVLLSGFALWFLYDGFLNQEFLRRNLEEGDQFAVAFNQWGGSLFALLAIWFAIKAVRKRRAASRSKGPG